MNTKEAEEDPRYIKGQIYKIISPNTETICVGSTILTLKQRFSKHKSQCKTTQACTYTYSCTSMHIINEGDASIELIYDYPCKNKTELEAEEGRRMLDIRNAGFDVINKNNSGASAAAGGRKEYKKQYIEEYYKSNKEYYKEKSAEHYKNTPRFQCECCNKEFTKPNLNQHKKTKKYINNMIQINDN
jgi:hypothetical protein